MPDTPAKQPDSFVGWWEIDFHIRDGEHTDVTGIVEHVDAAGAFTVFRDGERIGGGRHVDFTVGPDGFTNVQEVTGAHVPTGRELAIFRCSGDVLEVCKASEHQGRPTRFESPRGSGWTHVAIRRISDDDPRIPGMAAPLASEERFEFRTGQLLVAHQPGTAGTPFEHLDRNAGDACSLLIAVHHESGT